MIHFGGFGLSSALRLYSSTVISKSKLQALAHALSERYRINITNSNLKQFLNTCSTMAMASSTGGRTNSRKFKWALDLNSRCKQEKTSDLASPPGYNFSVGQVYTETSKDNDANHLIIKKSWDLALGPLKQVPMNLFIMYMAGNSISIFPIMMVGMLIIRPIKALFTMQTTFKMIEGSHAAGQKIVYFLGNIVNIALALYKCQFMGLLPTHSSDWLAFVEPQIRMEYSGGGAVLT